MPDDPTTATTEQEPSPGAGNGPGARDDDPAALRAEAAARRRQLRDTEAERDQGFAERDARIEALTATLDRRDRAEVEALAADALEDPTDLWRGEGVELDGLRNEDGDVDPAAVGEAVRALLKRSPHYASRARQEARDRESKHQGPRGGNEPTSPSFGEALKLAR